MEASSEKSKETLLYKISEEFLNYRLGIPATEENILRFARCIMRFEEDVKGFFPSSNSGLNKENSEYFFEPRRIRVKGKCYV